MLAKATNDTKGNLQMLWLNSCPRCRTGDMYLDEDNSRHCLQCAYIQHEIRTIDQFADLLRALGNDIPGAPGPVRSPDRTQPVAI